MIRKQLRPTLVLFAAFAVLTGLLYPLTITGLAQALFPDQANGSLLTKGGQVASPALGSALIGQQFTDPDYFWGRLSVTGASPYNASAFARLRVGTRLKTAWIFVIAREATLLLPRVTLIRPFDDKKRASNGPG